MQSLLLIAKHAAPAPAGKIPLVESVSCECSMFLAGMMAVKQKLSCFVNHNVVVAEELPRLVAYMDPNMPPRDPVKYKAPNAFPLLLA